MQSLPSKTVDTQESTDISLSTSTPSPSGSISLLPQRPTGSLGLMGPMGGINPLGGTMGVSPRAGGPLGLGMVPVSFSMGGVQASQNVLIGGGVRTPPIVGGVVQAGSSVTSSIVPTPTPTPTQAPISSALSETIKKVAQFCASNGASTISMLKKKEGALNVMPFLFEGQIGFNEFLLTLKEILGMANANNNNSNNSNSSSNNNNNNNNNNNDVNNHITSSGSSSIPPPPVPPSVRPNLQNQK